MINAQRKKKKNKGKKQQICVLFLEGWGEQRRKKSKCLKLDSTKRYYNTDRWCVCIYTAVYHAFVAIYLWSLYSFGRRFSAPTRLTLIPLCSQTHVQLIINCCFPLIRQSYSSSSSSCTGLILRHPRAK